MKDEAKPANPANPAINAKDESQKNLQIQIKRVRSRVATSVRTGDGCSVNCIRVSDPTNNPQAMYCDVNTKIATHTC